METKRKPRWVRAGSGWILVWPDGLVTLSCREKGRGCQAVWAHIDHF